MTEYFRTHNGLHVHPLEPKAEEISIFDIARSLSHLCRFLGHTTAFYSVAQHSVLVSKFVPPEDALWGLLHDASEAYLADLPAPIKRDAKMITYRMAEGRLMVTICQRFGLRPEMPRSVIIADKALLATEFRDVTTMRDLKWIIDECGVPPLANLRIEPLMPESAKRLFLDRWVELTA